MNPQTMDQLTEKQNQYGSAIQQIISNYRKDPQDRKTLLYYQERLRRLEDTWSSFEATDNEIRIHYAEELNHPYFSKDYYEGINQLYETYRNKFRQMIESLQDECNRTTTNPAAAKLIDIQLPSEHIAKQTGTIKKTSQVELNDSNNLNKPQILIGDNQDEVTKLIRRQKAIINSLQRLVDSINRGDQRLTKQYYEAKIKSINQYWAQIENHHYSIWETVADPTKVGYNMEEYFQLESQVEETLIHLSEKLERCIPCTPTQEAPVKLPKINLPSFDGSYLKWTQFNDLYMQLIHNQAISKAQKMFYLTSNLTGEARSLIRHLPISEDNYDAAWEILKNRYENKRLLVNSLLNKFLSQPTLQNESAAGIKSLHDTTNECLLGLKNLGLSVDTWDPILVHLLIKKFDRTTHSLFEQSLESPRELSSVKQVLSFLETRFQALEALGKDRRILTHQDRPINKQGHHLRSAFVTTVQTTPCVICKQQHPLYACREFLLLTPANRYRAVKRYKLCANCLRGGHSPKECTLRGCMKCSKKHNTLVHMETFTKQAAKSNSPTRNTVTPSTKEAAMQPQQNEIIQSSYNTGPNKSVTLSAQMTQTQRNYVLLSTVVIKLLNNEGTALECRAVLDCGSQLNFITERVAKQLGLHEIPELMHIQGIGQSKQCTQRRINVLLQSTTSGFSARLEAFILPQITSNQPTIPLNTTDWPIPENIKLADPQFNRPDRIDALIGAELYYELLSIGQIKLGKNLPTLQNTVLGWVIAGRVKGAQQTQAVCGICSEDEAFDQQIEKFWKLEEHERTESTLTPAERKCETLFNLNVKRDLDGRFIVSLPFRNEPQLLGRSEDIALRRLIALERKFSKHEEVRLQYAEFMQQYIQLGHMEEIDFDQVQKPYYFLPHHCVMKPDSSTTKLRVVFDASAKTSSNISLNDVLHTGPRIQNDLFSILLRFRMPRFVFTADIEKMYRQVKIHENDRKYQLILWRSNQSEPIKCYQLNTVTYGTTAAPYLAIKCLHRLSQEGRDRYPLGSEILRRDFYVDDVMTGSDSIITASDMQTQLNSLLQTAGFKLRKWCANHPRLLQNLPQQDIELQLDFDNKSEEHIKTLGMTWLPKADSFCIKTYWTEGRKVTKRTICSDVAHLFDPLGIMAPVTVTAKMFLQRLWALKLDWDAAVPQELHTRWFKFREGLKLLNNIKIPRHIFDHHYSKSFQLHAFSDASEGAYGTAVYVRSINKDNSITVRLLCAKSRVAPIRSTTLPRLELCAAKLAAELMNRIRSDLNLTNDATFFWTDSEIVLAWLNAPSSSFQTFVANRVAAIQDLTIEKQWRHVSSKENPADIVSRGIAPEKLENCNLWFYGPLFLHGSESHWPPAYIPKDQGQLETRKTKTALAVSQDSQDVIHHINHRNSFKRLQRIVAYVLRFIKRLKKAPLEGSSSLTSSELNEALNTIVQKIQETEFTEDLTRLKRYGELDKTSTLSSLTPFLDNKGIIRVGGRLEASNLCYDAKHPILLPYSHPFTKLLMSDIHIENCHTGPQTLLAITRQKFWPIKGKTIARSIVQQCIRCARAKPRLLSQLMGNLPATRVQPARPFVNSGVDFCGPIWTHYKIRGKKPQKSYVAVFCCFSTKATHLELVTDLTTDGFIGALKRFIARRGHCRHLYCDNATNFIGAKNQLEELNQMMTNNSMEKIASTCSAKGIDFHLIPPRAPHFGGLWEAAVKSAKHLLQRTVASASLTYEELETVIVEIESILNSRPLTPISSDPNDLTALTPGHFLIGEPLTSSIDPESKPVKTNLLTRWKLVSHIKNEFWKRWSNEYLNELQHRYKWKIRCQNIQPGTMVIIKEDNLPASKWPLGRIVKSIKGDDDLVRVADVRTSTTVLRRPIHKLAPLPIETEEKDIRHDPIHDQDDTKHNNHSRKNQHSSDASETKPNNSSKDIEAVPRKRTRCTLGTAVTTLLLTCLLLPSVNSAPVEFTPFTSQPGIYFEAVGTTHLVSNEWSLIVFYNMTTYWQEYNSLSLGIQKLRYICGTINHNETCEQTILQFFDLLGEIHNSNQLLLQTSQRRNKRAPLNIVGNLASALFGVLDSEYAEQMSQTIEELKHNDQHLLGLIKNQTSIIDSTANIMLKSQQAVERQLTEMDVSINKTIHQINNISQELVQQRSVELFNTLSVRLILMITNYQRIQAGILDIIIDTHHGKVNPLLLSPSQLQTQLNLIKEHLPSTLRLPAKQNNLLELYSLLTVEGRVAPEQIIFRLKLPLFSHEQFELLRVIPVPVFVNGTFISIRPSSKFLMINLHRDQYYPLSEQELSSCTTISHSSYMCKQHHPIYKEGSNVSACEISFITHTPASRCKVEEIIEPVKWIQLLQSNQWIYIMPRATIVNIVCEGAVSQQKLHGSGIVKIADGCSIKEEMTTIQAHNIFSSTVEKAYTSSKNITDWLPSATVDEIVYHPASHHAMAKDIQDLQKTITQLQKEEELPKNQKFHHVHHFTIGYASLIIAVVVVAYLIWRCTSEHRKCAPNMRPPVPAPRTTTHPDDFSIQPDLELRHH